MKNCKKVIPIISLTALLALASASSEYFVFRNRFSVKDILSSDGIFLEDTISDNYENSNFDLFSDSFFVPQGLTFSNNYTFISYYDYTGINKSMIRVFSHDGHVVNTFSLVNCSHVGGIAFDFKNNLLWVASSFGTIDAYRLFDIINKENCEPYYSKLNVGSGLPNYMNPFVNSISFMTIYNDDLYVGSFSMGNKGNVKKYSITIDEDKRVILNYINSFKIPTMVQGLAFYERNGETYMLLSRSFGRGRSSALQIFKYDENTDDYTYSDINSITYEFPAMMEQIDICKDQLFALFESESKPYGGFKDDEYTLRIAKMDELLK